MPASVAPRSPKIVLLGELFPSVEVEFCSKFSILSKSLTICKLAITYSLFCRSLRWKLLLDLPVLLGARFKDDEPPSTFDKEIDLAYEIVSVAG